MIGRSHGIHAEPITAGLVFAGCYAEVGARDGARWSRARAGDRGRQDRRRGRHLRQPRSRRSSARRSASLGLRARDRRRRRSSRAIATPRYFMALARLGTAVERLALTVRHWQRTEVGEAEEAFGKGQKGSSAMPHKKNPILSREPVRPRAPAARLRAAPALEDVALWHERDISHSSVERVIGARRDRPRRLHGPARRRPGRRPGRQRRAHAREPRAHRAASIFSEAVLLALVRKGMARQAAYELVQRNALRAVAGEGDASATLLGADPDVAARLDAARASTRAFDLEHHLRHAGAIIDRALARGIDHEQIDRRSRDPRAARQDARASTELPRAAARSTRARCATATCATGERTLIVDRPASARSTSCWARSRSRARC